MVSTVVTKNLSIFGFGLYSLVSLAITSFVSLPASISALLVAPNAFIIPLLFGLSIVTFLKLFGANQKNSFLFTVSFFIGATIITIFTVLMQLLGFSFIVAHLNIVAIIPIVLLYIKLALSIKSNQNGAGIQSEEITPKQRFLFRHFSKIILILVVIVALTAPYMISLYRPVGTIGIDHMAGVEFVQPVERLVHDGIIDYWTARSMPVLISGIPLMFVGSNVSAVALYWALPFIATPIFALGMYFFVKRITKNSWVAFFSAAFTVFLNTGNGVFHDVVPHIFRYSTLATAVLPWALLSASDFMLKSVDTGTDTRKPVLSSLLINLPIGIFLLIVATPLNPFSFQREEITPFLMIPVFCLIILYERFSKASNTSKNLGLFFLIFGMFLLTLDPMEPFVFYLFGTYFFVIIFWFSTNKKTLSFPKLRRSINSPNLLRILIGVMCLYLVLILSGAINISQLNLPFDRLSLSGTSYTVPYKLSVLVSANTDVVMVLLIISIATLTLLGKKIDLVMTLFAITGLVLYFLPISLTMILPHHLLCILMGYVLAAGLFSLIHLSDGKVVE